MVTLALAEEISGRQLWTDDVHHGRDSLDGCQAGRRVKHVVAEVGLSVLYLETTQDLFRDLLCCWPF
jgi:hypothetical protein